MQTKWNWQTASEVLMSEIFPHIYVWNYGKYWPNLFKKKMKKNKDWLFRDQFDNLQEKFFTWIKSREVLDQSISTFVSINESVQRTSAFEVHQFGRIWPARGQIHRPQCIYYRKTDRWHTQTRIQSINPCVPFAVDWESKHENNKKIGRFK